MKTELPTLFEESSTGKIKQWNIAVIGLGKKHPATIVTTYGELDGKKQTTSDAVCEGKNIGKANETTPFEQATKEAQSKWDKKLKSGYVKTLDGALAGETSEVIEGGIFPMLAKSFAEQGGKILFPCAGQPKLDGIRCIAVKTGKDVRLFSRTRKPINSCPHVVQGILKVFAGVDNIILDGELYHHDLKADFESIVSAVRKDYPSESSARVQYHIYDSPSPDSFLARSSYLEELIHLCQGTSPLRIVPTFPIDTLERVPFFFKEFRNQGYEGMMLRNWESLYEQDKRSNHLQKVKEFEDAEYEIVGVEEGRGKLQGNLGAFVCKTNSGEQFKCKMSGEQESTKIYLQRPETVIGRRLVVQYQGLTGKNGVPRFPVGLRLLDTLGGSRL